MTAPDVTAPDSSNPAVNLLTELDVALRPDLLDRALTHRSFAYEHGGLPTNERLEFLGDSVLGLVVTEHLFVTHPDMAEGQLAKLRAAVVSSRALAYVARGIDLGALIKLGHGEETTGGRDKSSILADTTEAVIGAVFVEHGIDAARRYVHHLFDPMMDRVATLGAGLDWKTSLQEISALNGKGQPSYQVTESGPDHAKSFTAVVDVDGEQFEPGNGGTKKEAEQSAAAAAFETLRSRVSADTTGAGADGPVAPEPGLAEMTAATLANVGPSQASG